MDLDDTNVCESTDALVEVANSLYDDEGETESEDSESESEE